MFAAKHCDKDEFLGGVKDHVGVKSARKPPYGALLLFQGMDYAFPDRVEVDICQVYCLFFNTLLPLDDSASPDPFWRVMK